ALKKATESDRLKSAFLATMSHELRTPLNSIIGFSDLIYKDMHIDDIVKFSNTIKSSGEDLLVMVEDLFDITLIESGMSKVKSSDVEVNALLREILEVIKIEQYKTNKSNLELVHTIPLGAGATIINTDSAKLKQILINLLRNALKFTHEGHIHYGYSIETEEGKPVIKFFIEDTGIGVHKDKYELIFDVFKQVEDSHTRTYGGTGIGLSIAKKLTELLGGNIWVESEVGKGSTFYFSIPYEEPETIIKLNELEVIDIVSTLGAYNIPKEKTILIVEDDKASFEFLKVVLEKSGFNIIWAKDGEEAINACKEKTQICLVLMDINMLVMNGYEATRQIKKFKPNLPIIAQTAYASSGDREKATKAGCDDYISKPIKKDILMEKIGKWIKVSG
ncbi:MAG: ATP-binding protein, partial [Bacteroidota bacterium]